jgi:hypothetical protein
MGSRGRRVREIIDVGGTDLYGGSPHARGTAQCLYREPRLPRAGMQPGAEAQRQKILPPWSPRTRAQALQTKHNDSTLKPQTAQN